MPRLTRAGRRAGAAIGLAVATATVALSPIAAHAGPTVPAPPSSPVPTSTVAPPTTVPAPPTIGLVLAPYVAAFDTNNDNFNIATHVLLQFPDIALATTKPGANTVFLPTDYAFRALVRSLTGKVVVPERQVFDAIMRLGRPRVGAILKTHVLRNVRLTYGAAVRSNGAVLTTWLGAKLRVVVPATGRRWVVLQDGATRLPDPKIIHGDVRASNGVVHVIDRVMLPTNP